MDEISRAITLAAIAITGALITQIVLRWDQTRRDTKLRLLNDLRLEQAKCEGIAYKARHIILRTIDEGNPNDLCAQIDSELFSEVYRDSRLVTLCVELDSYDVPSEGYSINTHKFRASCYNIVFNSHAGECPDSKEAAIESIKEEIKTFSCKTKCIAKRIHHRFSWVYFLTLKF